MIIIMNMDMFTDTETDTDSNRDTDTDPGDRDKGERKGHWDGDRAGRQRLEQGLGLGPCRNLCTWVWYPRKFVSTGETLSRKNMLIEV
jgi:hypothetical protein